MSAVRRDNIREMLADLKLPGALEAVDDILAEVDRGSVTAGEALERLLGAQISLRNNRRLQTAMRSSRLAGHQDARAVRLCLPALDPARTDREPARARLHQAPRERDLSRASRRRQDPPGDLFGDRRRRVRTSRLLRHSGQPHRVTRTSSSCGTTRQTASVLSHPALLVVDEIGYLPVNRDGAVLFFQLINARYEHASTVLTSNKGFEEWGEILGDEVMAAALIDRLMHHCHVVNIRGNSYRMREHTDLWHAIQPKAEEQASHQGRPGRRRSRHTEGRLPQSSVQFSAATNEQFSSGVDSAFGLVRFGSITSGG